MPGFSGPKYLSPKGTQSHLYNVVDTQESMVWIVEGEIDCLSLREYFTTSGSRSGVVAIPGTRSFKQHWKWLFANSRVSIMMDADEEGQRSAKELAKLLRSVTPDVTVTVPPPGMDVNDLFRAGILGEVVSADDR